MDKKSEKVKEFLKKEGHPELVAGGAIGAIGVGTASAGCASGICTAGVIAATAYPASLVLAPILIALGLYKKYGKEYKLKKATAKR